MNSLSRYSLSSVGALTVTAGLGLWMTAMIAVEFIPQDKADSIQYEINPVAEDIALPPDRIKLKTYKKIETPLPPTRIEYIPSGLPSVAPTDIAGQKLDFIKPDIDTEMPIIHISDTDVQPILRPPPGMPPRAQRSGHCKVRFDVGPTGEPFNIETIACSDRLFQRASIKGVSRWKFRPKVRNGRAVAMSGLKNQITFHLTDERGNLIPE